MDTIQTPLHAALVKVLIAQRIRAGLRQRDVTEFDAVRRSVERSGKTAIPAAPPLFRIRNPQEYAASLAHVRLTTSDSFPSGRSTRHILGARWCAATGLRAVSISLSPLLVYPAAPRFALAANAF
jgi:hypothetical protein